jgi:hypothetical protein
MKLKPLLSGQAAKEKKSKNPPIFRLSLRLGALPLLLSLTSCFGIDRDMGLVNLPDIQQREGITGTASNPTPLDPFKQYDLVMAAEECRSFTMKVPSNWYWKIYLTVANREESRRGSLTATIAPANPPWSPLPATSFNKNFDLSGREGSQVVLAVGNNQDDREALFQLCQDGAPLHITIQSEVSATHALLGPNGDSQGITATPGE